ncbi:hypothetical protein HPB48_017676 [Haemaphysalis longicornis]|uniref:NHR domain-containing protein n=1 Tax=Haemaphysalis longicornis TaxID=44386 RepID=A0A9J6FUA0_HAELO|nr:hypothetical protein HPB48_017676 [Haemaphysalis longicornis]
MVLLLRYRGVIAVTSCPVSATVATWKVGRRGDRFGVGEGGLDREEVEAHAGCLGKGEGPTKRRRCCCRVHLRSRRRRLSPIECPVPAVFAASGDALEATAEEDGCAEKVRRMSLHEVHGDNVRLKDDGSGARRADGFRKGVVFSARPVGADEKVKVRVTSCCTQWSGALRLGFTAHDPATMKGNVPSSAFPNLKNTPGNWVAKLEESLAAEGTELSFCVTYKGDMIVCVNDEEGEVVLSGVDTTRPLWAMVDIFGNTTGIELTLPDTSPDLEPVVFHEICGANVRLAEEGRLAQRVGDFCKGVTFSSRPVYLSERLFLRVKESCTQWSGSLRLGFTSNDPALSQGTLPSSSYPHLKNSPGNWVKVLDESYAKVDNLIHFCVNDMGEGLIGVNGGEEKVFLKGIDVSGNLWALIDIYGNTVTVEMAGM